MGGEHPAIGALFEDAAHKGVFVHACPGHDRQDRQTGWIARPFGKPPAGRLERRGERMNDLMPLTGEFTGQLDGESMTWIVMHEDFHCVSMRIGAVKKTLFETGQLSLWLDKLTGSDT